MARRLSHMTQLATFEDFVDFSHIWKATDEAALLFKAASPNPSLESAE